MYVLVEGTSHLCRPLSWYNLISGSTRKPFLDNILPGRTLILQSNLHVGFLGAEEGAKVVS